MKRPGIAWRQTGNGKGGGWIGHTRVVEILPYDEPPDYCGFFMVRFIHPPAGVDTFPGDVDFSNLEKAKAYVEQKLSLTAC
jgi:hypothetical protein